MWVISGNQIRITKWFFWDQLYRRCEQGGWYLIYWNFDCPQPLYPFVTWVTKGTSWYISRGFGINFDRLICSQKRGQTCHILYVHLCRYMQQVRLPWNMQCLYCILKVCVMFCFTFQILQCSLSCASSIMFHVQYFGDIQCLKHHRTLVWFSV